MSAINKIQYNISRDTTDALEKIIIHTNIEYCSYGKVRDLTSDNDLELRERAHYELHKAIDEHSGFYMTDGGYTFLGENLTTDDEVENVVSTTVNLINQNEVDYLMEKNNFLQKNSKPFVIMEDIDMCLEHKMYRALWRNPAKWFDRDGEHNIWLAHSTKQAKKVDDEYCRKSIDINQLDQFLSYNKLLV